MITLSHKQCRPVLRCSWSLFFFFFCLYLRITSSLLFYLFLPDDSLLLGSSRLFMRLFSCKTKSEDMTALLYGADETWRCDFYSIFQQKPHCACLNSTLSCSIPDRTLTNMAVFYRKALQVYRFVYETLEWIMRTQSDVHKNK